MSTVSDAVIDAQETSEQMVLRQASALLRQAMRSHEPPLTPVTLGERLGVSRQAVLRMLSGQNVQLATYAKYLDACGHRLVLDARPTH